MLESTGSPYVCGGTSRVQTSSKEELKNYERMKFPDTNCGEATVNQLTIQIQEGRENFLNDSRVFLKRY